QADDAERARTALLHDQEEIGDTKPRTPAHQCPDGEQALAEETESGRDGLCRRDRVGAETRQPRWPRVGAPGLTFGYGLRHCDESTNAVGEPGAVRGYAPGRHLAEHLEHECD